MDQLEGATYEDIQSTIFLADRIPMAVLSLLAHTEGWSHWRSERTIRWILDQYPDTPQYNGLKHLLETEPVLFYIFAKRIDDRLSYASNKVNYIERDKYLKITVKQNGLSWEFDFGEIEPAAWEAEQAWWDTIPEAILVQKEEVTKKILTFSEDFDKMAEG